MKRIRLKARAVPQPCMFRDTCHGSCEWCQTHSYTEACVGMLQHQCECLRKNWVAAEQEKQKLQNDVDALREHFKEVHAQPHGSLYTLEEIAEAICNGTTECSEACIGWKYDCRKGQKGTLTWLREMMNKEVE